MITNKIENLQLALMDLDAAIARHKDDDGNNVLSDLIQNRVILQLELDEMINPQKAPYGHREGSEL